MTLRAGHPLRTLFSELVRNTFRNQLRYYDPEVADYISELLTDFARTDQLYKIRDAAGRRLDDVGEMLIESNPLLEAASFERARELRKHIGDYPLFPTGPFPAYLNGHPRTMRLR